MTKFIMFTENNTKKNVLIENSDLYLNNLLFKWCCDGLCDIKEKKFDLEKIYKCQFNLTEI